jgi:hypothetical protein
MVAHPGFVVHSVADDDVLAGQPFGVYRARCGATLLPASLTEPARGRCADCRAARTHR